MKMEKYWFLNVKNYIVEKRKNVPVTRRQEPLYFKSCNYLEISQLTLFNAFIFVYTPEDNIQVLKSKPGKWAIQNTRTSVEADGSTE